ncbi:hypothetical protein D3C87_1261510 [compost metagenome]
MVVGVAHPVLCHGLNRHAVLIGIKRFKPFMLIHHDTSASGQIDRAVANASA